MIQDFQPQIHYCVVKLCTYFMDIRKFYTGFGKELSNQRKTNEIFDWNQLLVNKNEL